MIPETHLAPLRGRVVSLLQEIDQAWTANGLRPVAYRLTPAALERFRAWYTEREGSIFERRLDTYGHRLMLLLAATSGQPIIDEDLVERVVALLRYQLDVRRESDPVDAENVIAAVEEKIRRALGRGALKGRDLKRRVHTDRVGLWVWTTAIENLTRSGELARDRRLDLFWLKQPEPAVTTPVTTTKTADFANADTEF